MYNCTCVWKRTSMTKLLWTEHNEEILQMVETCRKKNNGDC